MPASYQHPRVDADPQGYSLQADKLKKDEDEKRTAADKVKDARKAEIIKLKQEFELLGRKNKALDPKY